jgi:hypothetical protein
VASTQVKAITQQITQTISLTSTSDFASPLKELMLNKDILDSVALRESLLKQGFNFNSELQIQCLPQLPLTVQLHYTYISDCTSRFLLTSYFVLNIV